MCKCTESMLTLSERRHLATQVERRFQVSSPSGRATLEAIVRHLRAYAHRRVLNMNQGSASWH